MQARTAAVLLTVLLAGCSAPPSGHEGDHAPTAARDGPLISGSLGDFDHMREDGHQPTRGAGQSRLTHDPDTPNVTKDGEPSFGLAILIRETWNERDGALRERHPCGGVVVATPEGWPDPRAHFDAFTWESNATVVDERGRAWLTDRYVAKANASARVWVQNVGGGAEFLPDMGAHCPAPMYEEGPLNVLLHIDGPERVDLWFHPPARPELPARDPKD